MPREKKDRRAFDEAAAQMYGFLIGGVVFLGVVGGVLVTTRFVADDPRPTQQAAQAVDAQSLMDLLTSSPGSGWATPDSLQRLGLLNANRTGIDPTHLDLLRNATQAATANGKVDYDEARASLGLTGQAGFNLSIAPVDAVSALAHANFTYHKVLYIGHFNPLSTITLSVANASIAGANAALNLSMANGTGVERDAIAGLGFTFNNQVHLTTTGPNVLVQVSTTPPVTTPLLTYLSLPLWNGDVLFDDKQYLGNVLPTKLTTGGYDLLVIGSGLDQSTLTASAVKNSIGTFVQAGGTLMVFGSTANNYNWLQPLFSAQSANVAGAITAVDPNHPVLSTPYTLQWGQYNDQNLAWNLGSSSSLFEHVLVQGGYDVLAIAKVGSFGAGHVLLTSVQPSLVSQALGSTEAQHFIFNMILYDGTPANNLTTLQYGPRPPSGLPISSATATALLQDASLGPIPVRVQLLVWGTS